MASKIFLWLVVMACPIAVFAQTTQAWVYEKATGKWHVQWRDPSVIHRDPSRYTLARLPRGRIPDPILERYDVASQQSRLATEAERFDSMLDLRRVERFHIPDVEFKRHAWTEEQFRERLWQLYGTVPN